MCLLLSELYDIKDTGKCVIHQVFKQYYQTIAEAQERIDYEIQYLGPNWYTCRTDGSAILFRYRENYRIPERIIHYVIVSSENEKGLDVIDV